MASPDDPGAAAYARFRLWLQFPKFPLHDD
ncbi:MAG: hypothetical protein QOE87_3763, partial [Gaiellales bacterium]|nr:hypothetical protein [Gaiellales bacterium]